MLEKLGFKKKSLHTKEFDNYLKTAKEVSNRLLQDELKELGIHGYVYSPGMAVEELGLDNGLVQDLIEDYVTQIIKNVPDFKNHIDRLKTARDVANSFQPLRDLAHKNLGVAKNLRILDAQKILNELMKKEDLEYLNKCVDALEACAIILNPKVAHKVYKLQQVKTNL